MSTRCSACFLLVTLLTAQFHNSYCQEWWCTLIKRNVLLNTLNCTNLPGVNQVCASPDMSGTRPFLCTIDPKLFSAIIIGVFGALHECQNRFKNRPWNCSVFDQAPCQGKFTENGARETAFLNAIISAGIAREVARQCKKQTLESCACDFSVAPSNTNGITVITGCGDNRAYGNQVAQKFTDTGVDSNTCTGLIALQNNAVGRKIVNERTSESCICHGVSGSCTVKTCFKKVPDIEEIGEELLKRYDIAKRVKKGNGKKIVPAKPLSPPLTSSELAYCEYSPNFCKRDLANGVYGSIGRQCWQDRNDPSSCAVLCCGGPVVQRQVRKEDTVCEFVWCCRIECRVVRVYNVTEYYCEQ